MSYIHADLNLQCISLCICIYTYTMYMYIHTYYVYVNTNILCICITEPILMLQKLSDGYYSRLLGWALLKKI